MYIDNGYRIQKFRKEGRIFNLNEKKTKRNKEKHFMADVYMNQKRETNL